MLNYEKLEDGIFQVRSASKFGGSCNGILIKNIENSGNILIDCNFNNNEIQELYKSLNHELTAYYASHTHLDHVSNIHYYETLGVKIYCPIPEDRYLKDINIFMKENGMVDGGVDDIFRNMIIQGLNFKHLTRCNAFKPDTKFNYGKIVLETIHIPGHSPGQTAYLIRDKTGVRRDILFVSDLGIERYGPWYGLKHCNLKDYRNSIEKLEDIYLRDSSDDTILASGHGKAYLMKQPEIFRNTLKKIEINENKVLSMFHSDKPKKLDDITLKGVYYPEKHIKNLFTDFRKIHFFWERYIIFHHINELIEKNKLIEVDPEHKSYMLK